ncbi:MAG TPA: hypothetical protein VGY48_22425 [Vicinamibacterales bacterium]|nr:hypothetical protein [Vicinamibacterales bacterium]
MSRLHRSLLDTGVPVLIAAAGAALLIVQWGWGRMLWLDEEMIAINLRDRSIRDLGGPLSLGQAAPYGWLALQRGVMVVLGDGERALRLVPMFFGIATLATAVWVGRRWMTTVGAAMLVFLCAIGQWLPFHALELKHYSADACFGLLLPALALWVLEGLDGSELRQRLLVWWVVAAAGQWIANGALFVAPSCAVVLVLGVAWRRGLRAALVAASFGAIWLASFSLNYVVTLAPARANDFLRAFWVGAFPPPGAGFAGTARWLVDQLVPLAIKPGGSGHPLLFWTLASVGVLFAPGYTIAFRLAFALVPLSGFLWAGLRLAPMSERLALWFVPALYVGLAMATELCAALTMRARAGVVRAGVGAAAGALLLVTFTDIYSRGTTYLGLRPYTANHDLDDRGAVGWLARHREPGDVWITTRNALPAIWWYAGAHDSTPIMEASLQSDLSKCGADEIGRWATAGGPKRVLVYLGFGHDVPREFDDALLLRLGMVGRVTAYRSFASGHAIVVDLQTPSASRLTLSGLSGAPAAGASPPITGCVVVEPAHRW